MARKKVGTTGVYEIDGEYFRFMEGDEFPDGLDPKMVEKGEVATGDVDDEAVAVAEARALGAAPENRARKSGGDDR